MITLVIAYFMKIGIPVLLIGYSLKMKYQEKYLMNIAIYIERIREMDSEIMLKDDEIERGKAREEALLKEVVEHRQQLGMEVERYHLSEITK